MPRIGLGPEFLGRVRLASSIASLFGVWIFQNFLKEVKISQVLFWTTILAVPLGLTQVGRSGDSTTRTPKSRFLTCHSAVPRESATFKQFAAPPRSFWMKLGPVAENVKHIFDPIALRWACVLVSMYLFDCVTVI